MRATGDVHKQEGDPVNVCFRRSDCAHASAPEATHEPPVQLRRGAQSCERFIDYDCESPACRRFSLRERDAVKTENEKNTKRELVRNHEVFSNREVFYIADCQLPIEAFQIQLIDNRQSYIAAILSRNCA